MFILSGKPLALQELYPHIMRLFFASFLKALPYALLCTLLFLAVLLGAYALKMTGDDGDLAWAWLVYGALLAYPGLMSPLLYRVQAQAEGRALRFREPFTRALSCFFPCLVATIAFGLAVSAGFLLLIIPGLFLIVHLAFWWPALVLDRYAAFASLKASSALARGRWWRAVAGLSLVVAAYSVTATVETMLDAWPDTLVLNVIALVLACLMAVAVPILSCCAAVVTYHDLKIRAAAASSIS